MEGLYAVNTLFRRFIKTSSVFATVTYFKAGFNQNPCLKDPPDHVEKNSIHQGILKDAYSMEPEFLIPRIPKAKVMEINTIR